MSLRKLLVPLGLSLAVGAILSGSTASASSNTPPAGGGGGKPPTKPGTPPVIKPPAGGGPVVPIDWKGDGNGLTWASTLPMGQPTPAREAAILAAVKSGLENVSFGILPMTHAALPGHTALVTAMTRTLRIGKTSPVRVSCNYRTEQDIADYLNCAMCTPRILRRIREISTVRLPVKGMFNVWGSATMATTEHMIEYSQLLDRDVPLVTGDAFVSNENKDWVIASRLFSDPVSGRGWNDGAPKFPNREPPGPWSANYGWFKPDGGVIQSVGLTHDFRHVDYSQQVRLVSQMVILNGFPVHIGSILADPKFHVLLSDEGPLQSWAHPAFGKPSSPPIPDYVKNPGGVSV